MNSLNLSTVTTASRNFLTTLLKILHNSRNCISSNYPTLPKTYIHIFAPITVYKDITNFLICPEVPSSRLGAEIRLLLPQSQSFDSPEWVNLSWAL
jgi:hypothetical protein